MTGYFITGTDTDVGKTLTALSLLKAFKNAGHVVAGMKPVSAGCVWQNEQLCNEDALALQQMSSLNFPYSTINPFAFELAVAPHLAAENTGTTIQINIIKSSYHFLQQQVDVVIVEGAGGWLVPLDNQQTMADVVAELQLPVILVVGLRLGCLNHALLTLENIKARGARLSGWIVNVLDPDMTCKDENVETLKQRIESPLLGVIPFQQILNIDNTARLLNIDLL